jgi:hypothetical protein
LGDRPIIDTTQLGTLQRIIAVLVEAFEALHAHPSTETIEKLAILIHRAMTTPARHYHTPEHIFKFLEPGRPIHNLTALFHDIVYYQIDQSFVPEIWETLTPDIRLDAGEIFIAEPRSPADPLLEFALDLFKLQPGQKITTAPALNEFLSALVMTRQLAGLVPDKDLYRMTICIEATIPFRGRSDDNDCYLSALEFRLRTLSDQGRLPLSAEEIETTLQWAVVFANTDIDSFAESDTGKFLDGTWKLLPESNAALRSRETYTLRDYRRALQKMEAFLSHLNPDEIFYCYHNSPPPEVFAQMAARARQNVGTAGEYLRLKWLAMAVLEALADATGGDAPVSLFMGDIPKGGEKTLGLDDLLPETQIPPWVDPESALYKLLAVGRVSETSFDIKNSPLALFLYKRLRPERIEPLLGLAQEMFAGRVKPEAFLAQLDHGVVAAVARACAAMVYTRREKLLHLID